MMAFQRFRRRLLRLSLFGKILIANSAIVAAGATVATYLTAQQVRLDPDSGRFELALAIGLGGLLLSVTLNALVLRTALVPLARLERTARRVMAGELDARAAPGMIGDPHTDHLAATFNAMLDALRDNLRQIEHYSARLQELSEQRLVAQEEERQRVARELYDEAGQSLSMLLLGLRLFRDQLARPNADQAALSAQTGELAEQVRETLARLRALALELRPRVLDDLGLAAALQSYTSEWKARTQRPVTFTATVRPEAVIPPTTGITVYRLVEEALARLARPPAPDAVTVALEVDHQALVVQVTDHRSAAARSLAADGVDRTLAIFAMRERISLVGGELTVAPAPGSGTTLRAVVPLALRDDAVQTSLPVMHIDS